MTNHKLYGYLALAVALLFVVTFYVIYSAQNVSLEFMRSSAGQRDQQASGSVWADLKAKGLQGEHYTLNIHGKKTDFNKSDCTVNLSVTSSSNNIFVPSYSAQSDAKNQIVMTSGNAKGKWASTGPVYSVTDACTAPFDGDAAELILPPNDKGYYVTARVLGKPTNHPELSLEGSLLMVQDENGNDLLVLGLVDSNGFQTPAGTYTRTAGKVRALDISGLFEWSGSVCYFNTTNYCYDAAGQYTCTNRNTCCEDTNADGVFDVCADPVVNPLDGTESCTAGVLTAVGCRDYVNKWVFNIGDLVKYMWDVYTDGNFKLANIRFYPVR